MGIDPRGPRFSALITTVVLAVVLITGSVWLLAAQALVFAAGSVFRLALFALWLALPAAGPASAGPAPGTRARGAAAVRPDGRPGLRGRRRGRLRNGPDLAGRGGDRGRPSCGIPERSLRVLPRLRDVPAHPTYLARPPGPGAGQR